MARCLNLTKSGEYAVAALSRLVCLSQDNHPVATQVLAKTQKIPKSFLNKILAQCAKAKIVHSKKGVGGGITLTRPARKISLLEIVETCEGSYKREFCVFYWDHPCPGPNCPNYCSLRKEEESLKKRLKKITLANMARSLKKHIGLRISNDA